MGPARGYKRKAANYCEERPTGCTGGWRAGQGLVHSDLHSLAFL
jgi:hypothetical protein